jgi:hypothetical protein
VVFPEHGSPVNQIVTPFDCSLLISFGNKIQISKNEIEKSKNF